MKYKQTNIVFGEGKLWTKISVPLNKDMHFFERANEMQEWCKKYESNNSYYFVIGVETMYWWFEDEKDATIFSLIWNKND